MNLKDYKRSVMSKKKQCNDTIVELRRDYEHRIEGHVMINLLEVLCQRLDDLEQTFIKSTESQDDLK